MIRAFTSVGFVALFSGAAFGQAGITASGTSAPAFEAADVHVSAKSRMPSMAAGGLRGTRYLVRQATMVDLISLAYDIDNDKILGGPSWLDTDRFDVSARAPSGSAPEQAKLMLQTLLAERFSLKAPQGFEGAAGVRALHGQRQAEDEAGRGPIRSLGLPGATADGASLPGHDSATSNRLPQHVYGRFCAYSWPTGEQQRQRIE